MDRRVSDAFAADRRIYSTVSVCTRFGVHDTGYSLSPPLLAHSCLAKVRARWNESEREPLKASEDGTRQTTR